MHVCMYTNMLVSLYLYLCVNVSVHVCVYVCACLSVCACVSLWYANKICIFGMYVIWAKSVKCKNDICICLCVSVCACVCVYLYFCVCVVCLIYNLSIFGMYAKWAKSAKCEFFKKFITLRILLTDAQFIPYG